MAIKIIVYCLEGLSDILADELKWHGFKPQFQDCSSVNLEVESFESLYYLNAHVRVATNIDLLLYENHSCEQLQDALADIQRLDFRWLFEPNRSFAVRAERHGEHDFGSMDLMRDVASAMTLAMEAHGGSVHANLKDPDLYFRTYLRDKRLVLSLNTNGEVLSKRHSYPFHHAAQLNRTIAAAMIWRSDFFKSGMLIDPMCGGGTILYEAAHWLENRPIAKRDWPFAFRRHPYYREDGWLRQWDRRIDYRIPAGRLIGADLDEEKLAGAKANFADAGLSTAVSWHQADSRSMPYLQSGDTSELICNPPYGIRVLKPREVDQLYRELAQCCKTKDIKRVIAITTKKHSWLRSFTAAGYAAHRIDPVNYSNMPASIFDMHQVN